MGIDADLAFEPVSRLKSPLPLGLKSGLFWFVPVLVNLIQIIKDIVISVPPNKNMKKKSAVLPLNDPSSNILQYRYVKIILNKKLKPIVPKNKKFVTNRQI